MNILGVHIGHDSSAALVQDGKIVADVAEERFVRVKYYAGLPFRSIEYCLRYAGLDPAQIDVVAFPSSTIPPEARLLFEGPDLDFQPKTTRGKVKRAIYPFVHRLFSDSPRQGLPTYMPPFKLSKSVDVT